MKTPNIIPFPPQKLREFHDVTTHAQFLLDELLPTLVSYAKRSNTPTVVIAIASWLSLTTILRHEGAALESLVHALADEYAQPEVEA